MKLELKWLISLIKDPQAVSAWSIMPKYALTQKELDDLTDFILALDFKHHAARTVSKKEALREDFR